MNSNLVRALALAALSVGIAADQALGQSENGTLSQTKAQGQTGSSLDGSAIQSRIALYSDTTKGQSHAKDSEHFEAVARRFIAALSAREAKQIHTHCSVPFFREDERILDQDVLTARLGKILFPGVFAKAEPKRILLLDTLEHMEQLLEQTVPAKVRVQWKKHTECSSRFAVVSGGPMIVGLSLHKSGGEYTVTGLLFAYFPKQDSKILKSINKGLLDPR